MAVIHGFYDLPLGSCWWMRPSALSTLVCPAWAKTSHLKGGEREE